MTKKQKKEQEGGKKQRIRDAASDSPQSSLYMPLRNKKQSFIIKMHTLRHTLDQMFILKFRTLSLLFIWHRRHHGKLNLKKVSGSNEQLSNATS